MSKLADEAIDSIKRLVINIINAWSNVKLCHVSMMNIKVEITYL